MWTWILAAIVLVLCCLDYYFYGTKSGRVFGKVPGERRWPVLGHITYFVTDSVSVFNKFRSLAKTFKHRYRIQLGNVHFINIYNPHDIKILLSNGKHNTKSKLYDFTMPWLNEGLLTSRGDKWQERRKILTPAFHIDILRQFCNTFSVQSEKMVQSLKKEIGKPETDINAYVTEYTVNSICETAMGTQMRNSAFRKYLSAIHEIGKYFFYRGVRIWLYPNALFNLTAVGRRQDHLIKILHTFTLDVIRQRRKTKSTEGATTVDGEISESAKSGKRRLAMLDLLLSAESQGKIDEQGIREEVDTFLFEGHDTTAMALLYCLMLIANHSDVQERIVDELHEIFKDSKRAATMEDMNSMRYLEMCIKESLRLYPSVPFISRLLTEDVQLDDYLIPAGTACNVHVFDLHRDESIYPSPDEFIPERFSLENCAKRHPFAYIAFSAGPRNCIGQRFALYEAKSVISAILRNYRLEPVTKPEELVFYLDMVMRSQGNIKVKIFPR